MASATEGAAGVRYLIGCEKKCPNRGGSRASTRLYVKVVHKQDEVQT